MSNDTKEVCCVGIAILLVILMCIAGIFAAEKNRHDKGTRYAEILMSDGPVTIEVAPKDFKDIPVGILNGVTITLVEKGKVSLTGSSEDIAYIYKHY